MARLPRDSRIETREARTRLKARREPYWRQIHTGLSLGVYCGKRSSAWCVRRRREPEEAGSGRWITKRIGLPDDHADANGKTVLSYRQAVKRATEAASKTPEEHTQDDYTVQQAVDAYIAGKQAKGADTYTQELNFKNHVLRRFGKRTVASLKIAELKRWRDGLTKGRTRGTVNRILSDLKACLNKAYNDNLVDSNKGWRTLKKFENASNPRTEYLQPKAAKRLINACPGDFRALVRGALFTGARYSELAATQVRDFDAGAGTLTFTKTKSGKVRHVPLTAEAVGHFKLWTAGKQSGEFIFTCEDGSPWLKSQQSRRMRDACAAARIVPAITFHTLRHTFASLLVLEGVPLKFVSEVLGHGDSRMVEIHYAHLQKDDAVAKAIRQNLPSFGKADSKVRTL